jgi:hypothetical protein
MRVEVYVLSSGCDGGDGDVSYSEDVWYCSSALLIIGNERQTIAKCEPRVSRYCFVNLGTNSERGLTPMSGLLVVRTVRSGMPSDTLGQHVPVGRGD